MSAGTDVYTLGAPAGYTTLWAYPSQVHPSGPPPPIPTPTEGAGVGWRPLHGPIQLKSDKAIRQENELMLFLLGVL